MNDIVGVALATVAVICFIALFKCSVIALGIWLTASRPEKSRRIYEVYNERPWRCGLIGLVNTFVFMFVAVVLLNAEPLALLGLLLLVLIAFFHLWGWTAIYRSLAVKMNVSGAESGAPRALALGGMVTELMFLVPVVGQLLHFGMTMRGMGAVVVTMLSRKGGEATVDAGAATADEDPIV
ncbi:MAG: hypothetical protein L3K26_14870 [Candidatus Hydrogenedentes bacterium]|nr:hypothetical protein [Candidatus Hydrogenedentota bacterium]